MIALTCLLPMSGTDKDIEILALRHQLAVVQRQIDKPRLTPPDRAFLAALLHRLPRPTLRQLHLIVSPDTVLRWHRDLIRLHHVKACRPKRPGRPRTNRSIRTLVLRLVRENPSWGYRRVHGELATLGISVAPSTVWEILQHNALDPAPERNRQTWATFLHSHADALLPRRLPTHRSQGQNTVSQLRAVMPGQTRARRQGVFTFVRHHPTVGDQPSQHIARPAGRP